MDVEVIKSNIHKALIAVSKAISSKSTVDVVKNVAVEAKDNILKLSATDFEISISTYIGADIRTEGEITVNARAFVEFISLLPEDTICMKIDGNELLVNSSKTKSKFLTIPFHEFPALPKVNEKSKELWVLDKKKFIESVNKTTFSADRGTRLPIFSGVLFEFTEAGLNLVSSDGTRLSRYSLESEDTNRVKEGRFVVPYHMLDNISKLCTESEEEEIKIYLEEHGNQLMFQTDRILVTATLLEGDYPNYEAVIPSKSICSYKISLPDLIDSIKIANIFHTKTQVDRIVITKSSGDSNIYVRSRTSEVGENESAIEMQTIYEEVDIQIDFSAKQFLDILSRLHGGFIFLDVVEHIRDKEIKMFIVKEEGNPNYFHLLPSLIGV